MNQPPSTANTTLILESIDRALAAWEIRKAI